MLLQGTGAVLTDNCYFTDAGIHHIAHGEINGAVASCYRHGCDGALIGQLAHLWTVAAC